MDRRDFIKSATTLMVGATMDRSNFVQAEEAENQARLVLPMNRGWRYSPSFVEGGHELNFDDSRFDRVTIPHTNISLPWHGFDDKSYEFVSLYRRRFKLPAEARGPARVRGFRRRDDCVHRLDQRPAAGRIQGRLHAFFL